jgi:opacity protein-like surface antigen
MMKFNLLKLTAFTFSLLFFFTGFQANAQKNPEIFGLAGYQLNGDVTVAQGELNFDDGVSYGAGIDIPVDRNMKAEISWSMANSSVSLDEYLGTNVPIADLYIHTFQAGALIEPQSNKKVSPFGLLSLGATLFNPKGDEYDDEWRFSIALGVGVKVYLSDKVGLRFQGRLLIPMQFEGGSVYVGTGGAGVAVGAYTAFVQGDFSGGLFFRL